MRDFYLALMCAEKDPLTCHRTILVRGTLRLGIHVEHILGTAARKPRDGTGAVCYVSSTYQRQHLFHSREDVIEEAYRVQGERIAYDAGEASSGGAKANREHTHMKIFTIASRSNQRVVLHQTAARGCQASGRCALNNVSQLAGFTKRMTFITLLRHL